MDVSIITINYNSSEHTLNCVSSIIEHTNSGLKFEIIIVDNNSKTKDYENLKTKLPKVENIRLEKSRLNLGFGGGNNFGVNYAKGKYYLFLNNDCIFLEETLSTLFKYMEQNDSVGVIGPRPIKTDKTYIRGFGHFHNLIQHFIGIRLYEKFTGRINPFIDVKEVTGVDYVVGSFMFFRSDDFNKIGGFDSNIFLYYEEMDICLRLLKIGKKVIYFPKVTYQHFEGKSTLSKNKRYTILKEQQISYNYVFKKHYGILKYNIMYYWNVIKFPVKMIFNSEYIPLFFLHLKGNQLKDSLKQTQQLRNEI